MKPRFYLNGKRTTKTALVEKIGADRVKSYVRQAREIKRIDPNEQASWFIGFGMLTIEFA